MLGEKGRRIRELTAVVQKRFGFPEGSVEVRDVAELMLVCLNKTTIGNLVLEVSQRYNMKGNQIKNLKCILHQCDFCVNVDV